MLNHIGSRIKQDDRAEDIERLVSLMIKYGQIISNTEYNWRAILPNEVCQKTKSSDRFMHFMISLDEPEKIFQMKRRIYEFILIDSYPLQAYPFDCKRSEDLGLQIW